MTLHSKIIQIKKFGFKDPFTKKCYTPPTTSSVSITVCLGDKGDCLEIDICKVLPVEINILRNKSFAKVIPTFKLSDSFFRWFLKGSPKNPIVSKPLCMYCVPFLSF